MLRNTSAARRGSASDRERAAAADRQARQQIPGLLGALRVAQHVVAAGDQLHRRAEISCAARHRIRDRRGDQAEEHTGDQAGDQRRPRVGAEEAEDQADEQAQPGAGEHAAAEHFGPGQPAGDPFDLHQVDADDRHLLHRELLIGQVVDGALRLGVGRVGADRPALRRRGQPGGRAAPRRRAARRGTGSLSGLEGTGHGAIVLCRADGARPRCRLAPRSGLPPVQTAGFL